jgi:hypothetical protein
MNPVYTTIAAVAALAAAGSFKNRGSMSAHDKVEIAIEFDDDQEAYVLYVDVPDSVAGYGFYSSAEPYFNEMDAQYAAKEMIDYLEMEGLDVKIHKSVKPPKPVKSRRRSRK